MLVPAANFGTGKLSALLGAVLVAVGCGRSMPLDDLVSARSGSDAGVACTPPSMLCDGRCTNVGSDPTSCGGCGAACPAGDDCVEGACSSTGCPAGRNDCGGLCVDLSDNPINCGACNTACPPPETCVEGSCTCSAPSRVCGGVCTNVAVSAEHCGACGNPCAFDEVCSGGACESRCAPLADCGGRCVDLTSDTTACGTCDTVCELNEVCSDGRCVCPVNVNHAVCGDACVDLFTDANHCGACGNACAAGMRCQGGICTSCQNAFFFCPSATGDPLQTCLGQARNESEGTDAGGTRDATPAPLAPNLECQCNNCLMELQDCVSDSLCVSTWQCALRNACTVPCWDSMGVCSIATTPGGCFKWCAPSTGSTQTATRVEALLRCTADNACGI